MIIQTAIISGSFPGQFLGQKRRSAASEGLSEMRSSGELDLLNPNSRRIPQLQRSLSSSVQQRPFVELQRKPDVFSGAPRTVQALSESRHEWRSQSVGERLQILPEVQRTPTLPEIGRPGFLRLVAKNLGDDSKIVIGEHGVRRYEEFKRYHSGWDFGEGHPLSPRSVNVFESFILQLPELVACEPSLFLTHQGNLQLGWEDSEGRVTELEFFPDRIEFYLESLSEEGSIDLSSQQHLIEKIRNRL